MADLMKPFARGRAMVRTPPVLARYLDDLAKADRVAGDWDALAAAARGMDDALPPRGPVPPGDYTAAIDSMLPAGQPEPFADALLRNDRTRALIDSRLNRLSPEQMPGSLGLVGRQFAADQAAARAAGIRQGKDVNTAIALGAAGALGAGAFGARMAQESDRNQQDGKMLADLAMREQLSSDVRDIDITGDDDVYVPDGYVGASADDIPDLFAEDRMLPVTYDVDEISLLDDINAIRVPLPKVRLPRAYEPFQDADVRAQTMKMMAEQPFLPRPGEELSPGLRNANTIFAEDLRMAISPDSPDDAVAAAPGPTTPVGRIVDLEDLPAPQMRSIRALMGGGIPESRARDIILKGYSMSPDEYRMVTGGR
jgi:hypothetical protein